MTERTLDTDSDHLVDGVSHSDSEEEERKRKEAKRKQHFCENNRYKNYVMDFDIM